MEERIYQCPICDRKKFKKQVALLDHCDEFHPTLKESFFMILEREQNPNMLN